MSGSAGIAGFVSGLFAGANWREERNDKARKRKLEDETANMDRERFTWEREDQDFQRTTRKKEAEDDAELRSALREYAVGPSASRSDGGVNPPSPEDQPIEQPQPSDDVRVPAAAVPFASPRAAESGPKLGYGILGDVAGGDGREAVAGGAGVDRLAGPQQVAQAPVIAAPPQPQQPGQGFSILQVDPNTQQPMAMQPPRIEAQQRGKPASAPREMSVLGVNPNHQYGQPAGLLPDIGQLAARGSEAIRSVPNAIVGGAANVVNRAINPVARYATGMEIPLVEGAPFGPASKPVAAGGADPAAMPPAKTPAQGPGPRPDALAYGAAPKTDQGTPMASFSMGREMGLIGKDGIVKTTKAQTDRATKKFAAAYNAEAVPKVVAALVQQGRIDEANSFQEFARQQPVQEALGHWARAYHMFDRNNFDGAVDALADAYNTKGYLDDGFSINKSKSNAIYDDRGELIGAKIVFVNDQTGEEQVQNIDGAKDVIIIGAGMVAPEKVHEMGYKFVSGGKRVELDAADVLKVVEERALNDTEGFGKLPKEEQIRQVKAEFLSIVGQGKARPAVDEGVVNPLD